MRFESHGHQFDARRRMASGVLPVKYAYTGSGATTHARLAQSSSYREAVGEAELEIPVLANVLDVPRQWCEVGPGNGMHSRALSIGVRHRGVEFSRYLALDISLHLMRIAQRELRDSGPVDRRWVQWDFEAGPTSAIAEWRRSEPVLLTLSGATLGNVENPGLALRYLMRSLRVGDRMMLTFSLMRTSAALSVRDYETAEFHDAVIEPLVMAGVDPAAGKLRVSFDKDLSAVVAKFSFDADYLIVDGTWQHRFRPGDEIRCFLSRRYTRVEVEDLLRGAGLVVDAATVSEANGHLALVVDVPNVV